MAVTAAAYGGHVLDGGLYGDDWLVAAQVEMPDRPGFLGVVETLNRIGPATYHMLLPVQLAVVHSIAGLHWGVLIALGLGIGVLASTAFWLALRAAGLPGGWALGAAALATVFPWADAIRLWPIAQVHLISPALVFSAAVLTIAATRAPPGRRRLLLRGAALVAIALAVMAYESAAGLVGCSLLLYAWRLPLRQALRWWTADVAVAGVALFLARSSVPETTIDWGRMPTHARELADGSLTILAEALWPFTDAPRGVVLAAAAVVVVAALVRLRGLPHGEPRARPLSDGLRWLAAGAVLTTAGWIVLVPGDAQYQLTGTGVLNRTNLFTVFGVALVVVALARLAASLAFEQRGTWRPGRSAAVAGGAVIVALTAGAVAETRDHAGDFDRAVPLQQDVIAGMKAAAPAIPQGATLYTWGHPLEIRVQVPVFSWIFDVSGMVKLEYRDPTAGGYPVQQGTEWHCDDATVWPSAPSGYAQWTGAPYGKAVWVDVVGRRAEVIASREQCLRLVEDARAGRWPQNPQFAS